MSDYFETEVVQRPANVLCIHAPTGRRRRFQRQIDKIQFQAHHPRDFFNHVAGGMIHGTNKPAGVGLRSSHGCLRLYPEDIEKLFEMMPLGTPVRVVNEPFVFGWQEGELNMQAFGVLEDDTRNWKKAEKTLLSKSLSASIRKELKKRGEEIDWQLVSKFTHDPRGLPVSISRADASLDQVIASARQVQNRVPDGASWDGKSDLPMDEESFREMASETDPQAMSGDSIETGT